MSSFVLVRSILTVSLAVSIFCFSSCSISRLKGSRYLHKSAEGLRTVTSALLIAWIHISNLFAEK